MPWNVPIQAPSRTSGPRSGRRTLSSAVMRSRSSSAARSLKVTARICPAGTRCSTSQQKRSTAVAVLPVPGPAALEVGRLKHLLPIFLETRRAADGEDVLSHRAPDPVLRVPEGQEPRLESERLTLVVESVLAREVVERELHVVHVGAEVHLVRPPHRLARASLVVDDLDLAIADVVDSVDLADDLRPVQLQVEALLERERPEAADVLHAGHEADVVAEERPHLLLLALAVEHSFHS